MENELTNIVEGEIVDVGELVRGAEAQACRASRSLGTPLPPTADFRLPTPMTARVPISIRYATLSDVGAIDAMQKKSNYELGFLPTKAIEGKIKLRQLIVAEVVSSEWPVVSQDTGGVPTVAPNSGSGLATHYSTLTTPTPIGYLMASDRYFKRDEVGNIVQVYVLPEYRRSLVAAQLLQFQYDHSSYGCRLYCCWCAQDLKANEFWESMGFVPIAFRSGARGKVKGKKGKEATRIHIFWQRRIRAGDVSTPYWYPSQTGGGEMREDRLVFPIMPGVSWRDVMPVVLPEDCTVERVASCERRKMHG